MENNEEKVLELSGAKINWHGLNLENHRNLWGRLSFGMKTAFIIRDFDEEP
jgi:hypothetical protein